MTYSTDLQDFQDALRREGLLPHEILADGRLHRCPTADKPRSKNGWYVLHWGSPPIGVFGDWAWAGKEKQTWTGRNGGSKADPALLKKRIKDAQGAWQEEKAKLQEMAKERARKILKWCKPARVDHPYLARKAVKPLGDIRAMGKSLVLPILDETGIVTSLQFIFPDGTKRFLKHGKIQGRFFPIKGASGLLYICEGYATGATIHEATGATVLCALNAGNLESVARVARKRYSDREIIIAADSDHGKPGNPGLTKAKNAAEAVGAKVVWPEFPENATGTDFNDLNMSCGLDAVKAKLTESCHKNETCESVERRRAEEPKDPLAFPCDLLTGAAGAFATTYAQHLEVPAHFLWISYLTCLGSAAAGLVTLESEIRPATRIFALLLGESADDRKSTAISKTVSAFKEWVHDFASCWGIGSAEGLQKLMAKNSNLLLVFDEFKQFVSKCKIDGSILLPCVNSLFENTWYESHTAKSDVTLDNAHLSLLAASTVQTYERIWDSAFLDIGLPNRLFLVPGKGTRRFSIPSKVGNLPGLKRDLEDVLKHIGKFGEYPITKEARELYHQWYMSLAPSAHTKRLDTYALRFMVLLTANECKAEVDIKTVQNVIELMNWQLAVRQALDPIDADSKTARMEEKIRRALQRKNMTDRELKQAIHANREGIWIYQTAIKNLQSTKEIKWDRESKSWRRT